MLDLLQPLTESNSCQPRAVVESILFTTWQCWVWWCIVAMKGSKVEIWHLRWWRRMPWWGHICHHEDVWRGGGSILKEGDVVGRQRRMQWRQRCHSSSRCFLVVVALLMKFSFVILLLDFYLVFENAEHKVFFKPHSRAAYIFLLMPHFLLTMNRRAALTPILQDQNCT